MTKIIILYSTSFCVLLPIIRHAFRWHVWCLLWENFHESAPCIKEEINFKKYESFYVLFFEFI